MSVDKIGRYHALISKVKASYPKYESENQDKDIRMYWCDDCREINLWTYWQGRNQLNAKIMLVGQDWGSPWDDSSRYTMDQIRLANGGHPYYYPDKNTSITDARMISLFREIGYEITQPCDDLFFTNYILGYRNKGLSGVYKKEWAEHDREFFAELVDIVEPKLILCLGRSVFEGVLSSFAVQLRPGIGNYNQFIESDRNPVSVTLNNGNTVRVFSLAHCGALGTMNRNRGKGSVQDALELQRNDWRRMVPYL